MSFLDSLKELQPLECHHNHTFLDKQDSMWAVHGVSAADTNFNIHP
jgi:hypothetical protein